MIQEMLYHYTDIHGLKGILETQRLRLTNISSFKDTDEFVYTVSLLAHGLSLSPTTEREFLSELTQQNHLIFVFCSCKDADRIDLWKEYGRSGGYNIGFAEKDLRAMAEYQAYTGSITSYNNLSPCIYDKQKQLGIIKNALRQWEERENIVSGEEFYHLATVFKRPNFCFEQETRLIIRLKDSNLIERKLNDEKAVKYWEMPLRSFDGWLPINSITVGPTQYPEKAMCALRDCLLRYGLKHLIINHTSVSYQDFAKQQPSECWKI